MKALYAHLPDDFPEFVWEITDREAVATLGLLHVGVSVNPSLIEPPYRAWQLSRPTIIATGGTPGLALGALLEVPSVALAWKQERELRCVNTAAPVPSRGKRRRQGNAAAALQEGQPAAGWVPVAVAVWIVIAVICAGSFLGGLP